MHIFLYVHFCLLLFPGLVPAIWDPGYLHLSCTVCLGLLLRLWWHRIKKTSLTLVRLLRCTCGRVAAEGQAAESVLTAPYRYIISMSVGMKKGAFFSTSELMNGESCATGTFMVCIILMGFSAGIKLKSKSHKVNFYFSFLLGCDNRSKILWRV